MPSLDLKRLFLAHRREVQSYLTRKLRDAETAADLTQETFLRVVEHHRNGSAVITHHRSYLYRTAHNLAVDHVRARRHERSDPLPDAVWRDIAADAPSPEQAALGSEELDRLRAALLDLPERTREVFALTRIEGLGYRETADRLGISESSVQKHLAKAIRHAVQRLRPS